MNEKNIIIQHGFFSFTKEGGGGGGADEMMNFMMNL